ncbi:hypothetical protein VP01_2542g1 [Puccinia sorghi]|uniref:Uncharacterized protein n=1 Tax=Puccinia sorghi TaxID=27349 RepID=A0A0L6V5D3_9BASI|nr:hypothetical protein VP01_2542g1 [Puccinia sorghi]
MSFFASAILHYIIGQRIDSGNQNARRLIRTQLICCQALKCSMILVGWKNQNPPTVVFAVPGRKCDEVGLLGSNMLRHWLQKPSLANPPLDTFLIRFVKSIEVLLTTLFLDGVLIVFSLMEWSCTEVAVPPPAGDLFYSAWLCTLQPKCCPVIQGKLETRPVRRGGTAKKVIQLIGVRDFLIMRTVRIAYLLSSRMPVDREHRVAPSVYRSTCLASRSNKARRYERKLRVSYHTRMKVALNHPDLDLGFCGFNLDPTHAPRTLRMLLKAALYVQFLQLERGVRWRRQGFLVQEIIGALLTESTREESSLCDSAVQTYGSSARTRIGLIKLGAGRRRLCFPDGKGVSVFPGRGDRAFSWSFTEALGLALTLWINHTGLRSLRAFYTIKFFNSRHMAHCPCHPPTALDPQINSSRLERLRRKYVSDYYAPIAIRDIRHHLNLKQRAASRPIGSTFAAPHICRMQKCNGWSSTINVPNSPFISSRKDRCRLTSSPTSLLKALKCNSPKPQMSLDLVVRWLNSVTLPISQDCPVSGPVGKLCSFNDSSRTLPSPALGGGTAPPSPRSRSQASICGFCGLQSVTVAHLWDDGGIKLSSHFIKKMIRRVIKDKCHLMMPTWDDGGIKSSEEKKICRLPSLRVFWRKNHPLQNTQTQKLEHEVKEKKQSNTNETPEIHGHKLIRNLVLSKLVCSVVLGNLHRCVVERKTVSVGN